VKISRGLAPFERVFTMDAALVQALLDANATRYLSVIGLVILVYDWTLTFSDEVKYIWRAPASFAKYTFILNRYVVMGTLAAVAYEMCGFVGNAFSNEGCRVFIFMCSMIAVFSVAIANLLVLLRVVILWDHRPLILKLMAGGFVISFTAQTVTMILSLLSVLSSISWSPVAKMCIVTRSTHILVAVWASPMLFEALTLLSTAVNTLDRPRAASEPIIQSLRSDGIGYFLTLTCLRIMNVVLAATGRPSFTFLGVFFIWSMTTMVLNRSLLNMRRVEERDQEKWLIPLRATTPFTTRPSLDWKSMPAMPEDAFTGAISRSPQLQRMQSPRSQSSRGSRTSSIQSSGWF